MNKMSFCKKITIVILNYNGHDDTVECLESIRKIRYPLFNVLLVDNASTDGSLSRISDWAFDKFAVTQLSWEHNPNDEVPDNWCVSSLAGTKHIPLLIVANGENLGFASGCNLGIRISLSCKSDFVWLLNNDTIVEPDSLSQLVKCLVEHTNYQVATPQIRFADPADLIWNCGGRLTWYGTRKYYFLHHPVTALPDVDLIDITFVTGCAPLIRCSLLKKLGGFTERFFFGEEDFEFSMRMKKECVRMACCLKSVIYHKVGGTIDRSVSGYNLGKAYVYYLNRFINMKNYWPRFFWHIWRVVYTVYILGLIKARSKCSCWICFKFIQRLMKDSLLLDGVDKQRFFMIMNNDLEYLLKK